MTRLKTCDIDTIAENLDTYNVELIEKTGYVFNIERYIDFEPCGAFLSIWH